MTRSSLRVRCRRARSHVQVGSLSRNFGKEAALLAGLDHARLGAVLFISTATASTRRNSIETLVGHWLDDDYDVVYTAKAHRDEELFVWGRVAIKAFYAFAHSDSHVQIPDNAGDFPPTVAPRRQGAAPDAGAQPLLQRSGEVGSDSSVPQ